MHYGEGAKYEFHHDTDMRLARYATVLVYLNTPDAGGETIFPLLRLKGSRKVGLHSSNVQHNIKATAHCWPIQLIVVGARDEKATTLFTTSPLTPVAYNRALPPACPRPQSRARHVCRCPWTYET